MSLTNCKLKSLELLHELWEKCKIAASSATVPPTEDHVCNYSHTLCEKVSWRRIQAGEPESDSEASSEDHDLVLHGSYSEVAHCRWNCQCDQMHWYTAEVRGAISIALFQKAYPFCLKDDNEPCHLAKLV